MRFELNLQMKQLEKGLPGFTQYALLLRNIMTPDELREDMLTAISDRAFSATTNCRVAMTSSCSSRPEPERGYLQ